MEKENINAIDQNAPENMSFEEAITELERIVRKLESGEAKLEESIQLYERGSALKKVCQDRLKNAKMKVEKVILSSTSKDDDEGGNLETEEFDANIAPRI